MTKESTAAGRSELYSISGKLVSLESAESSSQECIYIYIYISACNLFRQIAIDRIVESIICITVG